MEKRKLKINIFFSVIKGPWGGGNQFLKALKKEFESRGVYEKKAELADVILFNSYQNLSETVKLKIKYPDKRFIHRLGPIFHLHRGRAWKIIDKLVIRVSNKIADAVIFQSQWSFNESTKLGFNKGKAHCIINNVSDKEIFNKNSKVKFGKNRKIKLIASSWSANWSKGFNVYKYLDENLDFSKYEMTFVGNSPIKFKNIKHIKPLTSEKLAKELKKHDIFISGIKDDACSNSILEALACGLPIVALNSGGNAEIIKKGRELFNKKEEVTEKIELIAKNYFSYQNSIELKSIKQIVNEYLRTISEKHAVKKTSLLFYCKVILIEFLFKVYNKLYNKIKNILQFIQRTIQKIKDLVYQRRYFPPPENYYGARHTTKGLYSTVFKLITNNKIKAIDTEVDLDWFIPDYKYEFRREVFELWDKRQSINFKKEVKKTRLYKQKGVGRILEICNLLESIRNNDYRDEHSKGKLPSCFLEMPSLSVRIDGTNRGSILRYLGHKTIKVKKILAKDFFTCKIPIATRTNLLKLWYKNYAPKRNLSVNVPDNIFGGEKERSGWYQDIELVPGVWTREPKIEQTNLVKKHMPDLSSRKVLDVGCCTGIYSFLAAEKRAAKVCGIDIGKLHIKRANFVKMIWSQGTSLYNSVEFKCLDILENLSMIKDFDTLIACNTLYLLGPGVHDFMKAVENSNIDLLFFQGQLKRDNRIGELNRFGVKGYERKNKTWGNILGTHRGLKNIIERYNFKIKKVIDSRNWPLYIVQRQKTKKQ